MRPASRLAAPRPTKSRLTSGPRAGSETKLRVVAAVCTMTTMATISARGAICRKSLRETSGSANLRRRARHRAERRHAARLQAQRDDERRGHPQPDQRAGQARIDAFARQHDREHAQADARERRNSSRRARRRAWRPARPETAGGAARPSSPGAWLTRMWPAIPARNPVVTGMDSRSATKPRRNDAGERENQADAEREQRRVGGVVRRARARQQRQRSGENRRDRRIRADRQKAARAEHGEADRPGDEREKADLRLGTRPDAPSPSVRVWRSRRASRRRRRRRRDRRSAIPRTTGKAARDGAARRRISRSSMPVPRARRFDEAHSVRFAPPRQCGV